MVQQIAIDPDLWARTRRKAFDTRSTASKIVAAALAEYLDRMDKPRADVAKQEPAPRKLREGGPMPWDPPKAQDALPPPADDTAKDPAPRLYRDEEGIRRVGIGGTITDSHMEGDVRVIDAVKLDHISVNAVNDPKEVAAKVEAALAARADREFHPVPKPVRKPRPKR